MWCTQTLHILASCHLTFTSPIFAQRGTLGQEESNIRNTSHLSSVILQFRTDLNPGVDFVRCQTNKRTGWYYTAKNGISHYLE